MMFTASGSVLMFQRSRRRLGGGDCEVTCSTLGWKEKWKRKVGQTFLIAKIVWICRLATSADKIMICF
jgi:hypothetical protein